MRTKLALSPRTSSGYEICFEKIAYDIVSLIQPINLPSENQSKHLNCGSDIMLTNFI